MPPSAIVTGKLFGANVNCPSDDTMLVIIRSDVPVFVTVAGNVAFDPSATFPKFRLTGNIEKTGSTPVPCTEYTVGEPAALCVNVKLPVLSPADVGVNVTLNTWLPPSAIVTGKLFGANVNCPSDDTMLVITRSDVPVFVTVAGNVAFDPTATFPKFRLTGNIEKTGSTPVPCTE